MVLLLIILIVVLASIAPPWSVVLIVVGCALEAIEILLLRRWAKRLDRRTKRTTGAEALIGERGEVVRPCRPDGMVRLRGELWEARCAEGADAGDSVRVEALDGLTLVVRRLAVSAALPGELGDEKRQDGHQVELPDQRLEHG